MLFPIPSVVRFEVGNKDPIQNRFVRDIHLGDGPCCGAFRTHTLYIIIGVKHSKIASRHKRTIIVQSGTKIERFYRLL